MWPFKEKVIEALIVDNEMYYKLNGILDALIFNEKVVKYTYPGYVQYYYEDEFVKFKCSNEWGINIVDNTSCNNGVVVSFYKSSDPKWYIRSEVCRKNLLNHLQSIVDMAEKLPSREEAFCKKLSGKV